MVERIIMNPSSIVPDCVNGVRREGKRGEPIVECLIDQGAAGRRVYLQHHPYIKSGPHSTCRHA